MATTSQHLPGSIEDSNEGKMDLKIGNASKIMKGKLKQREKKGKGRKTRGWN